MFQIFGFGALACVVAVVVILVTLISYSSMKANKYWDDKGVPFIKPSALLPGLVLFLVKKVNINIIIGDVYKKRDPHPFGGTVEVGKPILYIRDPVLIKSIMVKDFDHFVDHLAIDPVKSDKYFSNMLTQLEGKEWKDVRSVMTPTFTSGKIKRMFPLVMKCCEQLIDLIETDNIKGKQPLEAKDLFSRLTIDVVATIAFGIEVNSLKNKEAPFVEMSKRMQSFGIWRILIFTLFIACPRLMKILGFRAFDKKAMDFCSDLVETTIEYREKNSIRRNDFLQLMMDCDSNKFETTQEDESNDSYYKDAELSHKVTRKTVLSNDIITSQSTLFIFAGVDPTANVLQYASYQLAVNPQIQQRLYDEIEKVIAQHDGEVTYDAIHQIPYLDMVIAETMRLFPALPRIDRKCMEPYQIPDTDIVIEKDQIVYMPVVGLHMDEKYYQDPEKFDPERFSPENKASIPTYAYMPFGHGPRNCIGSRFGLMELNLALVCLLRKYAIKTDGKMIVPLEPDPKSIVFKPHGGVWLDFEPRQ